MSCGAADCYDCIDIRSTYDFKITYIIIEVTQATVIDIGIGYIAINNTLAVIEDIKKIDINTMTPVEAMNLLFELNNRLK